MKKETEYHKLAPCSTKQQENVISNRTGRIYLNTYIYTHIQFHRYKYILYVLHL